MTRAGSPVQTFGVSCAVPSQLGHAIIAFGVGRAGGMSLGIFIMTWTGLASDIDKLYI